MAKLQGTPCWYELATSEGSLGAAETFYGEVLGWTCQGAGMEGFDYHLASAGGDMVAGLMAMPAEIGEMPPFWMIYFAVDEADAAAARIEAAGGRIHRAPADIPGTGRFAIAGDPQGAGFGILQPEPMPGKEDAGGAFDQGIQRRPCCWRRRGKISRRGSAAGGGVRVCIDRSSRHGSSVHRQDGSGRPTDTGAHAVVYPGARGDVEGTLD